MRTFGWHVSVRPRGECKHSTSSMCTYGHTVTCRPRMHPADYSCILWTTQTSCVHKRCTCMPRMLTACAHICTCMLRMLADTPHLHAAHACREMSCITFPNPATDIMHCFPESCDRYHALLSQILSCIAFLKPALACGACLQIDPALACRTCLQWIREDMHVYNHVQAHPSEC